MTTYGSLFAGIGGLDLAVEHHYGAEPAWHAETDPAAATVLERHWPTVPNLGDVTRVDWSEVTPVDIITAGYPCQPFSLAGKRNGASDHRHLWPCVADAVRVLRPRLVVLENVAGHLSLGFGDVLGDLAGLGYDTRWGSVRASDAGAPHRRTRVFVVAADAEDERHEWRRSPRQRWPRSADRGAPPADASSAGPQRAEPEHEGGQSRSADGGTAPADADSARRGRVASRDNGRGSSERVRQGHPDRRSGDRRWGPYAPAIRRWEAILGERAPHPLIRVARSPRGLEDRYSRRLNPDLPRWMMGYPPGWLDGLTRTQALRAAGNAVCPQQAALALALLEEVA